MIIDRREVEFDAAALIAGVATSPRASDSLGLPGSVPHGVHFYPKEEEVAFLFGSAEAPRAVRLKAEAIGALLVFYCVRSKVPLPKKVANGVRIATNSVILFFRVDYARDVKPSVATRDVKPLVAISTSWEWSGSPVRQRGFGID